MTNICENRLDNVLANTLNIPNDWFNNIKYVLVQGDTTSALGLSLSAFHKNIKIIHLESGLRTYDFFNPYPEEMNRQLISRISDINFCPTEENKKNLENEKVKGEIYVVGNTVLDNLVNIDDNHKIENKVLITLHRRENHKNIGEWFTVINNISKKYNEYEFILPIHPNPNVQKHKNILTNVKIIEPVSHDEMIKLLLKSKLVITDSGGLQEECSFFNRKCLVCRKVTERRESLEQTSFLVTDPEKLIYLFDLHIKNFNINYICPFGDGTAKKIVSILKNIL